MVYVVIWIISAIVGYAIGNSKGRGGLGLVLGLLLGIIGIIIIAVMDESAERVLARQADDDLESASILQPPAAIEVRLSKLRSLLEAGVLSPGEYEAQRNRLLSEI